ncbi:MAG TPA: UbiX family flavin prenyltransferase [Vicinamibacterales bacterium]|nr:UbiX family flavin prenyltransferase [Vicinamibacterales bacterium]
MSPEHPPAPPRRRTFALAITGASGAIYATRTMAALLERECHLEVVISDYGRRLLHEELGEAAAVPRLREYLVGKYGDAASRGSYSVLSNKDLGATIASGSHDCEGMVIVPCSMKTLAGVAHGLSRNLIERAADVMMKEKRRLVLVPREAPMSLPQLRNMVLCAEAGAMMLPAMPAFYQMPKSLDDLADFMAGKILSALGFEQTLYPKWEG